MFDMPASDLRPRYRWHAFPALPSISHLTTGLKTLITRMLLTETKKTDGPLSVLYKHMEPSWSQKS